MSMSVRVFLLLFCFDCCYYCNFILNILFSLLSFVRSSFPFLLSSCCSFVCIFVTLNAAFLILRRWIKVYTPHLSSTFAFTYVYCYAMLCYALYIIHFPSVSMLLSLATTCNVNVPLGLWSTYATQHFHSLHLYRSPKRSLCVRLCASVCLCSNSANTQLAYASLRMLDVFLRRKRFVP